MNTPLPDKISEAVKSLGAEMKDAIDILSRKFEGAVASLGEEIDRLRNAVRGAHIAVQFEAEASTELGQTVFVVGNHPTLCNWSPEHALALDSTHYPKWNARIEVLPGTTLDYKYVRKNADGSFSWEAIDSNRVLAVTTGPTAVTRDQVRWA